MPLLVSAVFTITFPRSIFDPFEVVFQPVFTDFLRLLGLLPISPIVRVEMIQLEVAAVFHCAIGILCGNSYQPMTFLETEECWTSTRCGGHERQQWAVDSIDRCNTLSELPRWGLILQGLAWPFIRLTGD
jgi:hypothetical protein